MSAEETLAWSRAAWALALAWPGTSYVAVQGSLCNLSEPWFSHLKLAVIKKIP